MNPRRLIVAGEYEDVASITLQQENDDAVLMTTVEDLQFEHLVHARKEPINLYLRWQMENQMTNSDVIYRLLMMMFKLFEAICNDIYY